MNPLFDSCVLTYDHFPQQISDLNVCVQSEREGNRTVGLSTFFPIGTQYFYSYPLGEDSNYLNTGNLLAEELIAARAISCAGRGATAVVFPATVEPDIWHMYERLCLAFDRANIITLPIDNALGLLGPSKNQRVKAALKEVATPGMLVMAQPYLDPSLRHLYQIPPELAVWLNDKLNLPAYIPEQFLSKRYASFPNGASFASSTRVLPIPSVVKVSSSASGDGVRICRTQAALDAAKIEYAPLHGAIIVEEYIEVVRNFGIQFGIPFQSDQQIEIIGVSEQLTTKEGEFVGGIIDPKRLCPEVDGVNNLLLQTVLPIIRDMGWYGVGGFDVLLDRSGRFTIADPNFRMTAMTPYIFDVRNNVIQKSLASFNGTFAGTEVEFAKKVLPISREESSDQMLHISALRKEDGLFRFSAAMLYDDEHSMKDTAMTLQSVGIQSTALKLLSSFAHQPLYFVS